VAKISRKKSKKKSNISPTTQFCFPTGIYYSNLIPADATSKSSGARLIAELEEDIFALSQKDQKGQLWSEENYANGYTSYSSYDRLDLLTEAFAKLKKQIDQHVKQYLIDLDYDCALEELTMTQCWANVMFSSAVHTSHIHPNSVLSGTFYVKVPKGSSPIKFEDPRLGFFMNSPLVKTSAPEPRQRFYKIFSNAGDLVLFESWLRHEVPPMPPSRSKSKNEEPRISISFNYGRK